MHKVDALRRYLLVSAFGLLGACASPPEVVQPVVLGLAQPDASIIYFLRPRNDTVDVRDKPTLYVNSRPFAHLSFGSYAAVPLAPGKHVISLVAGVGESKDWDVSAEFETKPGMTYYVAVWHQRQIERAPEYAVALGPATEILFHRGCPKFCV